MSDTKASLVGDSFKMGLRAQSYWGKSIGRAFFFAEIGAGFFLMSYFFDFKMGMLLGLLITLVLKPYFHLAHMGAPRKALRALRRPDRSWISRGSIGFGMMIVGGFILLLIRAWSVDFNPVITEIVAIVALIGTVIVMIYQGLTMAAAKGITLWTSPFIPLASLGYALACGSVLLLALDWSIVGQPRIFLVGLALVFLLLVAINDIAIVLYPRKRSTGGSFSSELLIRGQYSTQSRYLVGVVGLVVPFLLLALGSFSHVITVIAAVAVLAGFYFFRLLVLRAGVFEPIGNDLIKSILPV